jgi:hypothetical protein
MRIPFDHVRGALWPCCRFAAAWPQRGAERTRFSRSLTARRSLADLFIGNQITVYARQLRVADFGDDFTRRAMSASRTKYSALPSAPPPRFLPHAPSAQVHRRNRPRRVRVDRQSRYPAPPRVPSGAAYVSRPPAAVSGPAAEGRLCPLPHQARGRAAAAAGGRAGRAGAPPGRGVSPLRALAAIAAGRAAPCRRGPPQACVRGQRRRPRGGRRSGGAAARDRCVRPRLCSLRLVRPRARARTRREPGRVLIRGGRRGRRREVRLAAARICAGFLQGSPFAAAVPTSLTRPRDACRTCPSCLRCPVWRSLARARAAYCCRTLFRPVRRAPAPPSPAPPHARLAPAHSCSSCRLTRV